MNDTPTSGPIASSSTHHDREAASSRHSFRNSQTKGELRKGKKDLFQVSTLGLTALAVYSPLGVRRQFVQRPFAAHASAAEQNEAVADACGVADLMDGEKHGSPAIGVGAQRLRHLARLAQIESVERLVGEQNRLRRQQADSEQHPFPLPFRQRPDRRVEKRVQTQVTHDVVERRRLAALEGPPYAGPRLPGGPFWAARRGIPCR